MKRGIWKTKLVGWANAAARQWGMHGKRALPGLVFLMGISLSAQNISFGTPKNFSIPDYYAGSNQKRSIMTGAEAIPQSGGRVLIKELRIETYDHAGLTNLIVEAPQCEFDYSSRMAWSSGPLLVRDARGRFTLQGQNGFLWKQTNSSLVISNDVRATIRKDMIKIQ